MRNVIEIGSKKIHVFSRPIPNRRLLIGLPMVEDFNMTRLAFGFKGTTFWYTKAADAEERIRNVQLCQNAPKCTKIHQMYPNAPKCTQMHPRYTNSFRQNAPNVPKCTKMHQMHPRYTNSFRQNAPNVPNELCFTFVTNRKEICANRNKCKVGKSWQSNQVASPPKGELSQHNYPGTDDHEGKLVSHRA